MMAISRLGMVIGALTTVLLVVVTGRLGDTAIGEPRATDGSAAERQAVAGYDAALSPLLLQGGQVVAEGVRPGVSDVANRAFDDEVLVRMATGWVAALEDITADMAGIPVPPALADVSVRYERALRTYSRAADALLAAALTRGDERTALVEHASELGRLADEFFDEAEAAFDNQRNRVTDLDDGRGTR